MPSPQVQQIQSWLRAHESELLDAYRELLRFPSLEAEAHPNAPFGLANRQALDYMLNLGSRWGMKTKDLEGYIGYAEFGEGEKLIMSLGHLDVVPVGPGWKHGAFAAELDNGYIYARGAVDDKGPTMASFFAMRAIMETCPNIGARMRSVFGCNEESGFKCIEHYVKTEEPPTYGIAPDSGWPLYHAEKGISNIVLDAPLAVGDVELLEMTGGQRPNIVIDSCVARVLVAESALSFVKGKLADSWDDNITFEWLDRELRIEAVGKAAHGSTPHNGDSAAIRMLRFLKQIAPLDVQTAYDELFQMTHIGGAGLGISGSDDVSRDLTTNLGIVETLGGKLRLTFNIRYPVTWNGEKLQAMATGYLGELRGAYKIVEFTDSKSLYFPLEHPLVKTVCEVYEEETGEKKRPGVMGGGTYARAIANTVSVGTGWDGDGAAHETDERLKVDHLYKMSRIYAHILYRLAN